MKKTHNFLLVLAAGCVVGALAGYYVPIKILAPIALAATLAVWILAWRVR